MAGQQPLEKDSSPPGAFPDTPAAEDNQTFSVNPIPASGGAGGNPIQLAPGEKVPDSSEVSKNTVESTVHDDPELKSKDQAGEQTYGVAPIPAMGGGGNPVQLQPGEKVPDPSTLTNNTVESTVKTDQASYEKSDAGAPVNAPAEQFQQSADQAILSGPGPVIPESSMPMGNTTDASKADIGPTISSAGPDSTTAQLAGQVPKEPRGVPEIVSESQEEAGFKPEASANPEAIEEKKEVENELQKKVSEAPSTSESGAMGESGNGIGAKATAGVAAAGAGVAGAAVAANEFVKDKTNQDPKAALPQSVQDTVDEKAKESSVPQKTTESTDAARETTTTVPEEVKESQAEVGQDAEASGSAEAVKEKAAVEEELLKKVPESEAQGEPAPTDSAAAATTAPVATTTSATGAPQLGDPTAGVAPISMDEKPGDSGLNAPADSEAKAPADKLEQPTSSSEHRDVSPMSKPTAGQPSEPQVTTGVGSSPTPRNNGPSSSTPQKRQSFVDKLKGDSSKTPESSDGKKEKRRSFFGKLKDKLKS
jgi:hypothetical protein